MKEELSDILEFLREEIEREELTENFESIKQKVNELINEVIRREEETKDSVTKKLLAREKEILLETIKLIQLIRFKKILELYSEGREIRGLSDDEKSFIEKVREIFATRREREKIGKYVFAVVLKEIPQFVGVEKFINDGTLTEGIAKLVDTGLYATYILLALAVLSVASSSVFKLLR